MDPKNKIDTAWIEFIGQVTSTLMKASDEEVLDIHAGTTTLGPMPEAVAQHVRTYAWVEISYRKHAETQDRVSPHLLCFKHRVSRNRCLNQHANTGAKT